MFPLCEFKAFLKCSSVMLSFPRASLQDYSLFVVMKSVSLVRICLYFWLPLSIFEANAFKVEEEFFGGLGFRERNVIGNTKSIPSIFSLFPKMNFIALSSLRWQLSARVNSALLYLSLMKVEISSLFLLGLLSRCQWFWCSSSLGIQSRLVPGMASCNSVHCVWGFLSLCLSCGTGPAWSSCCLCFLVVLGSV